MSGSQPSDGVFALLADETRLKILEALARAQLETDPVEAPPALSFSEIYEQVGIDTTSKFSYHLGKLVGTFIYKSEDGYSFTHVGDRIVRFILAGNYEQPDRFDPIEIDERCLFCGSIGLEAMLDQQNLIVSCTDCEESLTDAITPAQVYSRDATDLLDSVAVKQAAEYRQVLQGICPTCGGKLMTDVLDQEDCHLPGSVSLLVHDECEHCLESYTVPLAYRVAYHPASVAFHWDHGVDITSTGSWELCRHLAENRWSVERLDETPLEYLVVLRQESEELRVSVDADATVTRTERVHSRIVE